MAERFQNAVDGNNKAQPTQAEVMEPGINSNVQKYRNGWRGGLPETPCGYGSRIDQTAIQRKTLARWAKAYGITTLVDVGAGDLNWIQLVDWPHPVAYIPLDLVPRHPDVREFDILREVPPACDALMCLWVLNHMPNDNAALALDNLMACKARYLIYTWWPAMADFLDLGALDGVIIRPRIGAEMRIVSCL